MGSVEACCPSSSLREVSFLFRTVPQTVVSLLEPRRRGGILHLPAHSLNCADAMFWGYYLIWTNPKSHLALAKIPSHLQFEIHL